MDITDIILVVEKYKGSETNSLMNFMDFLEFVDKDSWLSRKELVEDMMLLGRTSAKKEEWMESYFAADKTVSARYCADEKQMEAFLQGGYNTDRDWRFDGQGCSEGCLNYLKTLDINMDNGLYRESGTHRQMKKLDDYRFRLQIRFNLFLTLSQNVFATDSIKSEAVKAMYEEFGTGRQDIFLNNLESGKYDPGFTREATQQKSRTM